MVVGTGMNSALLSSRDSTHSLLEELNLQNNAFFSISSMVPIHQVPNLNTSQSEKKLYIILCMNVTITETLESTGSDLYSNTTFFFFNFYKCIMYVRNLEELSKNIRQVTILIFSKLSF